MKRLHSNKEQQFSLQRAADATGFPEINQEITDLIRLHDQLASCLFGIDGLGYDTHEYNYEASVTDEQLNIAVDKTLEKEKNDPKRVRLIQQIRKLTVDLVNGINRLFQEITDPNKKCTKKQVRELRRLALKLQALIGYPGGQLDEAVLKLWSLDPDDPKMDRFKLYGEDVLDHELFVRVEESMKCSRFSAQLHGRILDRMANEHLAQYMKDCVQVSGRQVTRVKNPSEVLKEAIIRFFPLIIHPPEELREIHAHQAQAWQQMRLQRQQRRHEQSRESIQQVLAGSVRISRKMQGPAQVMTGSPWSGAQPGAMTAVVQPGRPAQPVQPARPVHPNQVRPQDTIPPAVPYVPPQGQQAPSADQNRPHQGFQAPGRYQASSRFQAPQSPLSQFSQKGPDTPTFREVLPVPQPPAAPQTPPVAPNGFQTFAPAHPPANGGTNGGSAHPTPVAGPPIPPPQGFAPIPAPVQMPTPAQPLPEAHVPAPAPAQAYPAGTPSWAAQPVIPPGENLFEGFELPELPTPEKSQSHAQALQMIEDGAMDSESLSRATKAETLKNLIERTQLGTDLAGIAMRIQKDPQTNIRIKRLLGAGGMGAVFLARDIDLERDIAIKVIKPGFEDLEVLFTKEAAITAKMEEVGCANVYSVMNYPEGKVMLMKLHKGADDAMIDERIASLINMSGEELNKLREQYQEFNEYCQLAQSGNSAQVPTGVVHSLAAWTLRSVFLNDHGKGAMRSLKKSLKNGPNGTVLEAQSYVGNDELSRQVRALEAVMKQGKLKQVSDWTAEDALFFAEPLRGPLDGDKLLIAPQSIIHELVGEHLQEAANVGDLEAQTEYLAGVVPSILPINAMLRTQLLMLRSVMKTLTVMHEEVHFGEGGEDFQGVSHADLKPANIMLSKRACEGMVELMAGFVEESNKPSREADYDAPLEAFEGELLDIDGDGEPSANPIDFGMVKQTGSQSPNGEIMGTPLYMLGSQVACSRFNTGVFTPRADLYSMGLSFLQFFTGRHPLNGYINKHGLQMLAEPTRLGQEADALREQFFLGNAPDGAVLDDPSTHPAPLNVIDMLLYHEPTMGSPEQLNGWRTDVALQRVMLEFVEENYPDIFEMLRNITSFTNDSEAERLEPTSAREVAQSIREIFDAELRQRERMNFLKKWAPLAIILLLLLAGGASGYVMHRNAQEAQNIRETELSTKLKSILKNYENAQSLPKDYTPAEGTDESAEVVRNKSIEALQNRLTVLQDLLKEFDGLTDEEKAASLEVKEGEEVTIPGLKTRVEDDLKETQEALVAQLKGRIASSLEGFVYHRDSTEVARDDIRRVREITGSDTELTRELRMCEMYDKGKEFMVASERFFHLEQSIRDNSPEHPLFLEATRLAIEFIGLSEYGIPKASNSSTLNRVPSEYIEPTRVNQVILNHIGQMRSTSPLDDMHSYDLMGEFVVRTVVASDGTDFRNQSNLHINPVFAAAAYICDGTHLPHQIRRNSSSVLSNRERAERLKTVLIESARFFRIVKDSPGIPDVKNKVGFPVADLNLYNSLSGYIKLHDLLRESDTN